MGGKILKSRPPRKRYNMHGRNEAAGAITSNAQLSSNGQNQLGSPNDDQGSSLPSYSTLALGAVIGSAIYEPLKKRASYIANGVKSLLGYGEPETKPATATDPSTGNRRRRRVFSPAF